VLYAPELVQAHLKGVFNTHHGPRRRFVPQNVLSGGALGKKSLEFKFKINRRNFIGIFFTSRRCWLIIREHPTRSGHILKLLLRPGNPPYWGNLRSM
jgi:hypothetical protein